MMDNTGIGTSFDPTRQDQMPNAGSSPSQALQVIGLHLPKLLGGRQIVDRSLATQPSHVGQTPEALIMAALLKAANAAGSNLNGGQPGGGVADLLKIIDGANGRPPTPSIGINPNQPSAPPPSAPGFNFTSPAMTKPAGGPLIPRTQQTGSSPSYGGPNFSPSVGSPFGPWK